MSLTARERRNPPPRRKSCAACIKSKRRCDFALPACLRCSQRGISCQYPFRALSKPTPAHQPEVASSPSPVGMGPYLAPSVVEAPPEEPSHALDAVLQSLDAEVGVFGAFDLPMADDNVLQIIQQPFAMAPPSRKDIRGPDEMREVIASRLQYAMDQLQQAPSTMVLEMTTPWCHPQLYKTDMPRSMQDAHACCALYMAKNRVNEPVIFRTIESRVMDLLAEPVPQSPLECLAYTHALLLYQIIRLFDGDIAARASAERDMPELETAAIALYAHAKFDTEDWPRALQVYPIGPTKAFWMEWLFQESMRRTVMLTFFLMQLYRVLAGHKNLSCDSKLGICHSWTLSSYLWHAQTPASFAKVWGERSHFVVSSTVFPQVLQEAMAEDVDDYGRIIMSSIMGIEETEAWFASRGGKL